MISRAAKSVVKVIGQRNYQAGEENLKLAMIGGAGEIGRNLSQVLKQTSKLDVLALYDVAATNKKFSIPYRFSKFSEGDSIKPMNSKMLTMLEKSHQPNAQSNEANYLKNFSSYTTQNETEKLVEALHRLPIAEEGVANPSLNSSKPLQGGNELRGPRILGEMGPDTLLRRGRIVSEIYRQFPVLANTFHDQNSSKRRGLLSHFEISDCLATTVQSNAVETLANDCCFNEIKSMAKRDHNFVIEISKNQIKLTKKHGQKTNSVSLKPKKTSQAVHRSSIDANCCVFASELTALLNTNQNLNVNGKSLINENNSSSPAEKLKSKIHPRRKESKVPKIILSNPTEIASRQEYASDELSYVKLDENSNTTAENFENKFQLKKRDAKSMNTSSILHPVDKKLHKEADRSIMTQKTRTKKARDSKNSEEMSKKGNRQRGGSEKSKNWTIPAALSDRKPRSLYGLINQKRGAPTWFFSKLLDARNIMTEDIKYRGYKTEDLSSIQNQKLFVKLNQNETSKCTSNASTSTNDLNPEVPKELLQQEMSKVTDTFDGDDSNKIQQSGKDFFSNDYAKMVSSNDESEYESASDISEASNPPKKISSRIAKFLANLNLERLKRRSRSLSSLASFNLDCLFELPEPIPLSTVPISSATVLFSSSDSSRFSFKDKFRKKSGCKKEKEVDICKKRVKPCKESKSDASKSCAPKKTEGTCKRRNEEGDGKCKRTGGDGKVDPCKPLMNEQHGVPCKNYEEDKEYGKKEDPLKKFWRDDIHGKLCKNSGDDPCAKYRTPDIHGESCKDSGECHGDDDPLDKFWNNELHGDRCNKGKDKKDDKCKKTQENPCKKTQENPCKKKQENPCKKKQENPCKKTQENPCKKTQENPCKKKEEPKKTEPSCNKVPDCKTATKDCGKDSKKEKCPPVFRAPGCPDNGKGGGKSRKYSTIASYAQNDFYYDSSKLDVLKDISITMKSSRSTAATDYKSGNTYHLFQEKLFRNY